MSVLAINKAACETFYCTCSGADTGVFAVTEKAKGDFFCSVYSALFRLGRAVVRFAAGFMRRESRTKFHSCKLISFTGVRRL